MIVERTKDGKIEPPLDQNWSPLEKLRWHAAVLHADTGKRVDVDRAHYKLNGVPQKDYFIVSCATSTFSPVNFRDAWTYINGIGSGILLERDS